MTDYLGPLTLGSSGTYALMSWERSSSDDGLSAAVEVMVSAATADALTLAVEALAAQLRVGNSYIHAVPGATSPVAYQITGASDLSVNETEGILAFWAQTTFTLSLAAYPAGALSTMYSAEAVDSPASLSLAALLGTRPMQLDVCIDDDNSTDMHSVWCALAPTALSDSKWLVLASALTWTTMSSGTGATYWGNSNRYTTSASWQTASLDTSAYPAGKYRLLARVRQEAGTGYIMDSQNQEAVAVTRTTPHIVVVGDVDLPVQDTAPGTAANLTLYARSDGTNDLMVNAFVLLPLDLGYFSWHPDVATDEIGQIDVGPSGVFMDSAADATYLQGGILTPKTLAAQTGTLIGTASPTGDTFPADWGKTATGVSADTSRFKCVGASKYAWYALTNTATPLVIPDEWYQLDFTRDVDSYVAGAATAQIVWQDVDGNTVQTDTLSTVGADDAAPVAVTVCGKAPAHAVRAQVKLGTDASGDLTVYWSAVSLCRCPLRLIVVAEDAAGVIDGSYVHPVHVTLKYTPKYEVAR